MYNSDSRTCVVYSKYN